jgi:hypothetical protein
MSHFKIAFSSLLAYLFATSSPCCHLLWSISTSRYFKVHGKMENKWQNVIPTDLIRLFVSGTYISRCSHYRFKKSDNSKTCNHSSIWFSARHFSLSTFVPFDRLCWFWVRVNLDFKIDQASPTYSKTRCVNHLSEMKQRCQHRKATLTWRCHSYILRMCNLF